MRAPRKYLIVLFFMAAVGALHAVPLHAQTQQTECPPECTIDTMEIVTWYPSPYNEYEELRLYPTQRDPGDCDNDKIGLMYYDHGGTPSFPDNDKMMICKGTLLGWQEVGGGGYWDVSPSNSNDIYYAPSGNVGIGTATPNERLDIQGGHLKLGALTIEAISGGGGCSTGFDKLLVKYKYNGSSCTSYCHNTSYGCTITDVGWKAGGNPAPSCSFWDGCSAYQATCVAEVEASICAK